MENSDIAGLDGVVQKDYGSWVINFVGFIGFTFSMHVELTIICYGVSVCDIGAFIIIAETNSLKVVRFIETGQRSQPVQ